MVNIDIAKLIPIGSDNAISRELLCARTGHSDRDVRRSIHESDEIIVPSGKGYFRPDNSKRDKNLALIYCRKEKAKAAAIFRNVKRIEEHYGDCEGQISFEE